MESLRIVWLDNFLVQRLDFRLTFLYTPTELYKIYAQKIIHIEGTH